MQQNIVNKMKVSSYSILLYVKLRNATQVEFKIYLLYIMKLHLKKIPTDTDKGHKII